MTTVFDIRYWRLAVVAASACLASALAGCADEGDGPLPMPEEGEVAEVPVTITFGTAWEQDGATRVPPPGQEADPDKIDGWDETKADKVRIVTFRRKDMDNQLQGGAVNDAPFTYDPTNDYVVDCVKGNSGENFKAEGTIRKIYGYEYRVVAIAYYSGRENAGRSGNVFADGEQNLFTINAEDGTTFDDFKATVKTGDIWSYIEDMDGETRTPEFLNRKMAFVPEFFYGYCVTESGEEIIKFAELGDDGEYNKTIPLTGILYRGVAKIQVNLELDTHIAGVLNYEWTIMDGALFATNVMTVTGLSSYDDFLTPSSMVPNYVYTGLPGEYDDYTGEYTAIDYKPEVDAEGERTLSFTAFVLPAKMKLAVRFFATREALGISHYTAFNGQIYVDDKTYNGGEGATGIISPDAQGNVFYFRRNHKYVLTGTSTSVLSHELD